LIKKNSRDDMLNQLSRNNSAANARNESTSTTSESEDESFATRNRRCFRRRRQGSKEQILDKSSPSASPNKTEVKADSIVSSAIPQPATKISIVTTHVETSTSETDSGSTD